MSLPISLGRLVIDAPGLTEAEARRLAQLATEHLGRLAAEPGRRAGTWGAGAAPGRSTRTRVKQHTADVAQVRGEAPEQLARRVADELARALFDEAGR